MPGGYAGGYLRIDLDGGKIDTLPLNQEWCRLFIGGRGLGARMLWELHEPGLDPLDPRAPLLLLTGPLTGLVPGGAQTCVVFKSPATGVTLGHALVGGHWGPELKMAGYDGLIIQGKAASPAYLFINNDRVEIREASHLWGLTTSQAEHKVREELGDKHIKVLTIGPAGENLVSFASLNHETFHAAARGGPGAVMGSKNLKAIAVRGTKPLKVSDPGSFWPKRQKVEEVLRDCRHTTARGYSLHRWGSTISSIPHSDVSELDVKNYREAFWPEVDLAGGLRLERRAHVRSRGCFSCPISCFQVGMIRQGRYRGYAINPDFDSSGTIGPGCLIADAEAVAYLSRLGDELGCDDASLGNVTGFAMECYEKGLITEKDLGFELKWGDALAVEKLWQKIIKREGLGDLLAQGVKVTAEKLGGEALGFAMHVKGLEFAGYAPQAHHDRALQYAVGDRGGCHHFGMSIAEQNQRVWADSLTVCTWHGAFVGGFLEPSIYVDLLTSATGNPYDPACWDEVADRLLLLARAYNIREGMVPLRDDVLPERVHKEPLTQGPKSGSVYPKEKFLADRAAWYRVRGCDEKGIPLAKRMEELQLSFALP